MYSFTFALGQAVGAFGAGTLAAGLFSKQANEPSAHKRKRGGPQDVDNDDEYANVIKIAELEKNLRAKTIAVAAAHVDRDAADRIHREQLRKENQRAIKMNAEHATELGKFEKQVTALRKEVEDERQQALLQSELLRAEQQRKRRAGSGGGGIVPAVAAQTKGLNKNEYGAGIYTAINGKLECKGLHAILDTGNAMQTMISQQVAMQLGLITRDGKPNQATKETVKVRGVVSGASEQAWQVHAKIVIRTNHEELVATTLEGTMCVSPGNNLGCDILVSASHIKELQRRGYGGVRC